CIVILDGLPSDRVDFWASQKILIKCLEKNLIPLPPFDDFVRAHTDELSRMIRMSIKSLGIFSIILLEQMSRQRKVIALKKIRRERKIFLPRQHQRVRISRLGLFDLLLEGSRAIIHAGV